MTRPEPVPADQGRNRRRRAEAPSVRDEPVFDLRYISSQLDGLGFYHENLLYHQMHILAHLPMVFQQHYPEQLNRHRGWRRKKMVIIMKRRKKQRRRHKPRMDQVFQQHYPGVGGYGVGPSGTAQQASAVEEEEDGDHYEKEEEAEEETKTEEDDDEEED